MINIKGMDKADVLRKLYNHASPKGLGWAKYGQQDMVMEDARDYINHSDTYDYIKGRAMKIRLVGDEFNEIWYDKYNGKGTARRAIDGR